MKAPFRSIAILIAEGSPAEVQQIVLRWRIDMRQLIISRPDDKYKAWLEDLLVQIQNTGECRFKERGIG